MHITSFTRLASAPIIAAAMLLVTGCASLGGGQPDQVVKQRAEAYWKARAAGQVDKAYELTAPSYRKVRTLDQFKMQFGNGVSVKGVSIVKVECETEKCTVRTKLEATPALMGVRVGTIATHLDEIWLLEDNQWWRYQEL